MSDTPEKFDVAAAENAATKLDALALCQNANLLRQACARIRELEDDLAEKKDIDELVGQSVAHLETQAFAAECIKYKNALAAADERACRWEDKVQRYGQELEGFKQRVEAAEAVAEEYRWAIQQVLVWRGCQQEPLFSQTKSLVAPLLKALGEDE